MKAAKTIMGVQRLRDALGPDRDALGPDLLGWQAFKRGNYTITWGPPMEPADVRMRSLPWLTIWSMR